MTMSATSPTLSSIDLLLNSALQEHQRRKAIRQDCLEWCRLLGHEPAAHHRLILGELCTLMEQADYDTLLIFAPPGSAKSHHVSVAFPAWWLARNKTGSVLAASHSAELAAKGGRRVRNLVGLHTTELNIALAAATQPAEPWPLRSRGEYIAAGLQAG